MANGVTPYAIGYIPSFLDVSDDRGARDQFAANYISGWRPFEGFTFDPEAKTLKYPGYPSFKALAWCELYGSKVLVFQYDWVLVFAPDGTWEVSRMD